MKPTEFRVWFLIEPPGEPIYIDVRTIRDACLVLDTIVAVRINLENRDLPTWDVDVSGVEVKDSDGEWVDFYDSQGDDFEEYYHLWNDDTVDKGFANGELADVVGEY